MQKKKLRPYQNLAAKALLKKKKAILNLGPGIGKTIVSLAVAKYLDLPTLVVCEKIKIIDWVEEGKAIGYTKFAVTNYANVHKFSIYNNKLKVIIIDESQNMGGFNTKKGKAIINLVKGASYAFFVSATPLKSNPVNLYWPLRLCGVYKETKTDFRIRYCGAYYLPRKNILIDGRTITNFKELLDLKNSVAIISEKVNRKITIYKKVVEADLNIAKFVTTDKGRKKFNVPEFKKVSTIRHELGDIKLKLFKKYCKRNGLKSKAVFFVYHREIAKELAKFLGCDLIIGGSSSIKRQQMLTDFSEKEKGYIVISIGTGSEGLNIYNCYTCYFLELSYSAVTYKQACYRLAREMKDTKLTAIFFKVKNEHAEILNELKENYVTFNI